MAAIDRVTLVLGDLRERIEAARGGDIAWRELSLSGKVRTLLEERLQEIEASGPATDTRKNKLSKGTQE